MNVVQGNLQVGRYRGVPLLFHWSLPLGLLFLTRLRWVPGAWLGFMLLVLIHEFGHAFLVRRYRMEVTAIQLHGIGGECRYQGAPNERERAIIAWGGVLGQLLLLPVGMLLAWLNWGGFFNHLAWAFTSINLYMIVLNLLPFAPLDGAEAWKLPRIWWRRRKRRQEQREAHAQKQARQQQQRSARMMASLHKVDNEDAASLPPEIQDMLDEAMRRASDATDSGTE